jgi:hypothetical protein
MICSSRTNTGGSNNKTFTTSSADRFVEVGNNLIDRLSNKVNHASGVGHRQQICRNSRPCLTDASSREDFAEPVLDFKAITMISSMAMGALSAAS